MKSLPRLIRWVLFLMLFFILLMTCYRFVFFYNYKGLDRPFSGSAFLLGLRYDARFAAILGLFILIIASFKRGHPFKNEHSHVFWTTFVSLIFLITMIFYGADYYHYDYLKQRLNASVLGYLDDAGISGNMVWETYPVIRIILFFGVASVGFYLWQKTLVASIHHHPAQHTSDLKNKLQHTFFLLLLGVFVFGRLGQYPLRWSDAFDFADDFRAQASLNPFQSFFSSFKFRKSPYDLAKVKSSYPLISDYLGVQEKDNVNLNYARLDTPDTRLSQPNVVVVICESFSAYKSSMFGNKLDPTPYFNRLSKEGVFFERCFTPAFGTARGVWATVTGIPDVEPLKTASRNPMAVDQHTIINDFIGYEKFYFLGGSTTWANIRGLLKNNIEGLRIYEQDNFSSEKVDVWGISDRNLFKESNRILAGQQKPFFAIIQTADNHRPYTIPEVDLKEFNKMSYPDDTLKKYGFEDNGQFNAFRYADFNFKNFIEAAKKEKYFNNTIFVFVGDHGLRGDAGSQFPHSFTKQGILAEHVPMLFYSPALLPPQKIRKVASQLDILPSLAFLSGQKALNRGMGRNLFDSADKTPRYAFIADPDMLTIGLVSDSFYYCKHLRTQQQSFVSVVDDNAVVESQHTDSIRSKMSALTEAWYQTALFMLVNNKKRRH